ncbi:restriction endonuclease [Pseudonocardia petroleophila]|uniref:Restriction endonuclease n=1 Tax=Pseudonocardia petroleophila TaxID=37331 RepID=A0A7G7MCD7_9PSEU|nr:restriction endonuclease [Pseudonocardia petroleophila]QNG50448.1 restriction endonuclease [Pseudonocardia petroleophila]
MAGSREWERQQRRIATELERERRATERDRVAEEKAAHQLRVAEKRECARRRTEELEERMSALRSALPNGLRHPAEVDIEEMRRRPETSRLELGELVEPIVATSWELAEPPRPGAFARALGGMREWRDQRDAAKVRYDAYVDDVRRRESLRLEQVARLQQEHAERMRLALVEADHHNAEVNRIRDGLPAREKTAVESFLRHVLLELPLPEGFPHEVDVVFSPATEQALVQLTLPPRDVVPVEKSFSYIERSDSERTAARPPREIAEAYRSVVAQVVVLALRQVLGADGALLRVGVNAHVHAIDPATGEWEYPCLVSVDAAREDFPREEALRNVDAVQCLNRLKAIVSHHPYALEAVEPVLVFDLTKFAFVEGLDAVATLDARPNLLEMSSTNFEHLVRQLFEAQGAEGWTTTQSNDDGVDAVIVNRSNLIGGLAVVQAKRYKPGNVLGPSHYRELAGTMEEKKAGWGVLVTTSRFTAGCEQKAREHGRMQLIDGNRLIWLIKEYLDKDVLVG